MTAKQNVQLWGTAISPGMAMGEAFVYHDVLEEHIQREQIEPHEVEEEHRRLKEALGQAALELALSAERVEKEVSSALADIFRAHQQIVGDPALCEELRREIAEGMASADSAVWYVFQRWERRIRDLESKSFPQRCEDISDSRRRVLKALQGIQEHALETMPEGRVLVAHRLLPSDAAFFSVRRPAAVVVEAGSPGSHCAVLSRGMGIPGVVQLPGIVEKVSEHQLVLVDGLRGHVVVDPARKTRVRFEIEMEGYNATLVEAKQHSHEPAVTRDGVEVPVMANVGNRQDAELAAGNGADGIGLYRTEILFTSRQMFPTEDELVEEMDSVLSPFEGKPAVIRLLDVGGDKDLPYLHLGSEPDAFLGRRGVRLLLDFPNLLRLQLRALLRLSEKHDVRITVPMVTVAEDMKRIREALNSVALEMGVKDPPPLGP